MNVSSQIIILLMLLNKKRQIRGARAMSGATNLDEVSKVGDGLVKKMQCMLVEDFKCDGSEVIHHLCGPMGDAW